MYWQFTFRIIYLHVIALKIPFNYIFKSKKSFWPFFSFLFSGKFGREWRLNRKTKPRLPPALLVRQLFRGYTTPSPPPLRYPYPPPPPPFPPFLPLSPVIVTPIPSSSSSSAIPSHPFSPPLRNPYLPPPPAFPPFFSLPLCYAWPGSQEVTRCSRATPLFLEDSQRGARERRVRSDRSVRLTFSPVSARLVLARAWAGMRVRARAWANMRVRA